jgi:hypothetical protein
MLLWHVLCYNAHMIDKPIDSPDEIPDGLEPEEVLAIITRRGLSDKFFEETPEVPPEERPNPRN